MDRTRLRTAIATLALVLAIGGCGSQDQGGDDVASAGGEQSGTEQSGAEQVSDEEQAMLFVECMRDNGIDLPDPNPDPDGEGLGLGLGDLDRSDPTVVKAIQACRDELPSSVGERASDPEMIENLTEFARCMRDNGIDLPDPDPDGGFGGALAELDRESPEFEAAMETCQDNLPGRGGE